MGSTIPDVPRTDRPPMIPSLGLNVFFAVSSPSGIEMVTLTSLPYPQARHMRSTSSVIIFRGTLLMAACPIFCSRPGFVTLPTPTPPSSMTLSPKTLLPAFPLLRISKARPSRRIIAAVFPHRALPHSPASSMAFSTSRSSSIPFGVISLTWHISSPEKSICAAAFAAAAAQLPVVHPSRRPERVLPISLIVLCFMPLDRRLYFFEHLRPDCPLLLPCRTP